MKARIYWTAAAITLVTGSVAAYLGLSRTSKAAAYQTAAVERGDLTRTVEATGTLQAVTTVQVGSQVSGSIRTLQADFNSVVRKGQVIATLDPSLFETQVEQARATVARLEADVDRADVQLADARAKLARARELDSRQLIAAVDLETAELNVRTAQTAVTAALAQVAQARASLHQAQVNLSHTIIRSPIDGIVISRNVDVGQTVAASMQAPTLFVLARDLTAMQVQASIDESDIGRIRPEQPVRFRVDAYPEDEFEGRVSQVRLEPIVEQNVVSYTTIVDVANPDLKLKPGMTATISIEVARAENALIVPNAAVRFRPGPEVAARFDGAAPPREPNGRVWIEGDGAIRPVPVQLGLSNETHTAIVAGDLTAGSRVVTGAAAGAAAVAQAPAGSPLLPFGRRPGARR